MLFSKSAQTKDCFEIISLQFNPDVKLAQQEEAMLVLNTIVNGFEGFKSRDYYYSKDNGRWIEFLVWADEILAKQASEQVMVNPKALEVFGLVDEKTMIFSHYHHAGGIG